ncbi:hypothetical protein [Microbacterium hydrocarbonoxydans]|uniref:hypothetical protein n=1 Tax=Microbacterium hydrocarbonoxydans TaxID=273678 RepID=UPI0007BB8BF9|nr:hypothetical protein [Microbacterium hydrocarbonoxydans]GAT71727.1 hypothetical protein MHM582_0191 [Microbacterium sp. HM58-2]
MSDPSQPPVPPYASQPGPAYPPAEPQQPPIAQPYGSPPSAQAYPAAPAPRQAGTGNGLARAAFLVALITMTVTLLMSLMLPFAYRAVDFDGVLLELYSGATGLISVAGSVVALILGITALRRPGSPLLAGIAIGIAGSSILGTVITWMSSLFFRFF